MYTSQLTGHPEYVVFQINTANAVARDPGTFPCGERKPADSLPANTLHGRRISRPKGPGTARREWGLRRNGPEEGCPA